MHVHSAAVFVVIKTNNFNKFQNMSVETRFLSLECSTANTGLALEKTEIYSAYINHDTITASESGYQDYAQVLLRVLFTAMFTGIYVLFRISLHKTFQ